MRAALVADQQRVALRVIARAFGPLPATAGEPGFAVPPPPRVEGVSIHLVNRPGSVQTNLLFARPAIARRSPWFPAAVVANQSLGGGASSEKWADQQRSQGA